MCFDRETPIIIILWGLLLFCIPQYNSNVRYFEIKSLVPRTSNLRDSIVTVYIVRIVKSNNVEESD